ncbi:MAG: hypothetical protein GC145_03685 [Caulobacter sp.]|nr:hypothetical protein [Caulobacter sp.]
MSREDEDKVVSLDRAREREAERRREQARAARDAANRRRLAEQGPRAVRTGRLIGRALGVLILTAGIAAFGFWIWSLLPH